MNNTAYNDIILEEYLYGNENDSIILDESFEVIEKSKNAVKKMVAKFKALIKMVINCAKNDKKIRVDLVESIVLLIIPIILEIVYRKKFKNEIRAAKFINKVGAHNFYNMAGPEVSKAVGQKMGQAVIAMLAKQIIQSMLLYYGTNKITITLDKIFSKEKEVSKIIASGVSKEKDPVKKTIREKIKKIWEYICAKFNEILKKNKSNEAKQESVDYVFDMESTNLLNSIK